MVCSEETLREEMVLFAASSETRRTVLSSKRRCVSERRSSIQQLYNNEQGFVFLFQKWFLPASSLKHTYITTI